MSSAYFIVHQTIYLISLSMLIYDYCQISIHHCSYLQLSHDAYHLQIFLLDLHRRCVLWEVSMARYSIIVFVELL